jgi:hypothetical protein
MKVRYIEETWPADGRPIQLTKGREYEVLTDDPTNPHTVQVTDDTGRASWWFRARFEEVADNSKPMILPADPQVRKGMPITTGVVDYFPLALAEVAVVSKAGNDQHNPGQPLHWEKGLSTDHADCIMRHLIDRGARDTDGMRHSAKLAWRALALLQTELEAEAAKA